MDKPMIVVAVIAAILVFAPLAAILLASFASVHEDYARSLSGSAPGLSARLARRLLGYHSDPPAAAQRPAGHRSQPRQIRVPAGV